MGVCLNVFQNTDDQGLQKPEQDPEHAMQALFIWKLQILAGIFWGSKTFEPYDA